MQRLAMRLSIAAALIAGAWLVPSVGRVQYAGESDQAKKETGMGDEGEAQAPQELSEELRKSAGKTFLEVVKLTQEHRTELFNYCHALTGNVWDAEDLVQETMLKVHSRMGRMSGASVDAPKAYLFRLSTDTWIDWQRKAKREGLAFAELAKESAPEDGGSPAAIELDEAFAGMMHALSPRERVALMLCDVLGFTPSEASGFAETSPGAMKVALHRARKSLAKIKEPVALDTGSEMRVDPKLAERFVDAFNKRDMEALTALFAPEAAAEIVGVLEEYGPDAIGSGSLLYTLFDFETGEPVPFPEDYPRAKIASFGGEQVVLVWYTSRKDGVDRVGDIVRLRSAGDKLTTMDYYYFSPEVLRLAAKSQGVPAATHGYYFGGDHMATEEETQQ